ncbi:retrotransposon protein [Plasmopara halstedii]|uniref:Retrotransposon protein n=1 Tax=Plasmopara halstedii TaxID=4781 RepID=A0A0P1ADA5_PLAHL|nr:retrotransposon protein [Plasmopara halstedii]CEG38775.1 retrotransposon protein [Plasmopara halstedii]|eukprot:XP_024575144.1 retrotransposon protein [Plasmopara halstedii]
MQPEIEDLLKEYKDVFPTEFPDQLPPERDILNEIHLKPEAKPSNTAPLQLSKVERTALDKFVAEPIKKNWIKMSDSPWESNIFGVPKKDPVTGKFPSRVEKLHSNRPNMPIRWVINYRHINSVSDIAKIPLPHIEELFDRMNEAQLFSLLDLASGYHQMQITPTSRKYTAFRTNHEIYQ